MLLVRFFSAARRAGRAALAPLSALALIGAAARDTSASPRAAVYALAVLALLAAASRIRARARVRRDDHAVPPVDGGVALVAVAVAYAVASYGARAGAAGALGALPIVTVAAVAALSTPRAGVLAAGLATLAEALEFVSHGMTDARSFAVRVGLLAVAAALHHGLTRAEITRVRSHAERLLGEERARQKDAAKSFRLIAAPSVSPRKPTVGDDERRVRGSLDEIRETLAGLLELTRRAMGLQTCAIFWLDARGESLRLVEMSSDALDRIVSDPIPIGAGAVGGACAMGRPVVLSKLRPDYGGLTYYRESHGVKAFAALPISEEGQVRGVLVADRADDVPFDDSDHEALVLVAQQTLRHVHNERTFGMLEKSKDELAKLFAASRALGEALTEDEVIRAVMSSARGVAEHDVAVLAGYDNKTHEHKVRHVAGEGFDGVSAGQSFSDNSGIASAAIKTRHALPYRGHYDAKTQYVFTRAATLKGHESALCLPLVVRDHAIGTLTLAAKRRGAFPDATRQLLGVLAGHAAIALSNAAAVRRLEELATTDAMTGLLNKRSLESEFERRLRAAGRFGRKLSVVVTDIDKFKSVNDTYGHSTGDVVIKGLAAVLLRCKRETDAVARFGGEEFVLVCEETDTEGAYALAERIRTELEKTVFATAMGPLSVTCSLGVAEFPRDGDTRETLFSRADEALYESKRGGRNQTRVAGRRSPPVAAPGTPKRTQREGSPRVAKSAG